MSTQKSINPDSNIPPFLLTYTEINHYTAACRWCIAFVRSCGWRHDEQVISSTHQLSAWRNLTCTRQTSRDSAKAPEDGHLWNLTGLRWLKPRVSCSSRRLSLKPKSVYVRRSKACRWFISGNQTTWHTSACSDKLPWEGGSRTRMLLTPKYPLILCELRCTLCFNLRKADDWITSDKCDMNETFKDNKDLKGSAIPS